ncbi:cold shock domain-containing protein [Pseudomonas sp. RIT-To-2]|uniref:cold shock domain-containing protein n=1 Tax=Pseudomonas sp. RIT-To-2 TaxID=3462541 RepID=UPI002413ACEE
MSDERQEGSVMWFNKEKEHGWISCEGVGEPLFMPQSAIVGYPSQQLTDGQLVTFTVKNVNNHLQADDVRPK